MCATLIIKESAWIINNKILGELNVQIIAATIRKRAR